VCARACLSVSVSMFIFMSVCGCLYVYMCASVCACLRVSLCLCTSCCIVVCVCLFSACLCLSVFMCERDVLCECHKDTETETGTMS